MFYNFYNVLERSVHPVVSTMTPRTNQALLQLEDRLPHLGRRHQNLVTRQLKTPLESPRSQAFRCVDFFQWSIADVAPQKVGGIEAGLVLHVKLDRRG